MPTYSIKAPDGNTYQIPGPEGATDEQVREQVLKHHPEAGRPPGPGVMDKIGSVAGAVGEFAVGTGMGALRGAEAFPGAMAGLIGMAGEFAESAFPAEKGTERYQAEQQRQQFRKENPLPMATAALPHLPSEAAKLGESIGEFALASAVSPGSAAQRVLAAIGGGGGARLGEIITNAPYGRILGGFLGAFAPTALMRLANPFPATTRHRAATNILQQEGVTGLTAAETTGNRGLRYMESHTGESPLAGEAAAERLQVARQQFTGAVLSRIGETFDPDAATLVATIDRATARTGQQFDRLAARNNADPQFMRDYFNEISVALNEHEHHFVDPLAPKLVERVVDHEFNKLVQRGASKSGAEYKAFRSFLGRHAARTEDPELHTFLLDVQNAADNLIERSIAKNNPIDSGAWHEVRQTYRNLLAVKAANKGVSTGNIITPAKWRQAIEAQGRRGPELEFAKAADTVLGHLPQSGTAPRALSQAGLVKLLSTGVTGRTLMSTPVQRWLGNQELTGILRQMPLARTQATRALTAEGIRQIEGEERPLTEQQRRGEWSKRLKITVTPQDIVDQSNAR